MPERTTDASSPTRRRFLRWATGIGGLLSAILAGIPTLRAFLWPTFRRSPATDWIKLGPPDLFDLKVPTNVDFVETLNDAWVENRVLRNVWVYSEDGVTFVVYSGRCTHLGCSFAYDKDKRLFRCPCHEGVFDVKTGTVLGGPPPRALDHLETKLDDGILYCAYRDFRVGIPQQVPV